MARSTVAELEKIFAESDKKCIERSICRITDSTFNDNVASVSCVCEYVAIMPGYAMLLMFILVPVSSPLNMYEACMIKLSFIQISIVVIIYFV